ncbi:MULTISPECIES: hypothetical protein [Halorussus]|uniref:hypothetical protein n=1 Tax=Halorussus TaxID=1070314 RepID=UPI00209F8CA8|nr:hypothetical protein [Halorussus vallis]USZ76156.1 hypothetical protein NGM07_02245 [Halorussus vallis]
MSSSSDGAGRERRRSDALARLRSAVALALLVALAGCAGTFGFGAERSSVPPVEAVSITNDDAEPHRIGVLVTENESVVRWTSFELGTVADDEPSSRTILPPRSEEARGELVVYVRVDNASTRTVDLTSGRFETMVEDCARQGSASRFEIKIKANATTELLFGCE